MNSFELQLFELPQHSRRVFKELVRLYKESEGDSFDLVTLLSEQSMIGRSTVKVSIKHFIQIGWLHVDTRKIKSHRFSLHPKIQNEHFVINYTRIKV